MAMGVDMKEIDFSKAPEGATHYSMETEHLLFVWIRLSGSFMEWWIPGESSEWSKAINDRELIEIPNYKWTPQNNTLPLRDLSDDQAAQLFNGWRGGAEIEAASNGAKAITKIPHWHPKCVYRIKPKSERELFVEACTEEMRKAGTKCHENHEYFGALFDSGKFKLVKDCE